MAVTLPTTPAPASFRIRPIANVVDQAPPLGGVTQRLIRLGDRFAAEVTLPPMPYADAMAWFVALSQATGDTVLWNVPQPNLTIGSPGTPLVNGASQSGTSVNLDGFSASYTLAKGQFISWSVSSRRYLYLIATAKTANGSGVAASTAIWPAIRSSPADNATVEVSQPVMEGFIPVPAGGWDVDRIMVTGVSFQIIEAA